MVYLQSKDESGLQSICWVDWHILLQWKLCMCDSIKLFKYEYVEIDIWTSFQRWL